MPTLNTPASITPEMKEARRDYLDRHTPHVQAPATTRKGEPFSVTVRMGADYVHPDMADHHIQRLQLFDGERLLATAVYEPGAFTAGREEAKGYSQATFQIALARKARLAALSYCTQHGLWLSEEVVVEVEE
jgi:superoxide reductase